MFAAVFCCLQRRRRRKKGTEARERVRDPAAAVLPDAQADPYAPFIVMERVLDKLKVSSRASVLWWAL